MVQVLKLQSELIDTQWDVNYLVYITPQDNVSELIDTQWDVNMNKDDLKYNAEGINRYIVGCKYVEGLMIPCKQR